MTKFFIKNRKMTMLLMLIVLLFGSYSYYFLPRQESPDVSAPVALINVVYPGASPEDMETLISEKIEDALVEVKGYDYSKSTSKDSVSSVLIYLKDDAVVDESFDDLKEKMDEVKQDLPDDIVSFDLNTNLADTVGMIISLSSNNYSYDELSDYANNYKKELSKINGVSKFEIDGDLKKEIIVEVDKQQLSYYNISLNDVSGIIKSQNISIPSGKLDNGKTKIAVNTSGTYETIKELEDTIIMMSQDAQIVRLKDIANIYFKVEDSSYRFKDNNNKAVFLTGYFEDSKNIVLIGDEVKSKLDDIKKELPKDLKVNEIIFQPDDVSKSINDFVINLIEAIVLVIVVVFFGMGAMNAIIVSSAIPLSIAMTFIAMSFLGIKLEQMSISALIIALGMLVDNAIVVSDSIQHKLDNGEDKLKACIEGTKEVSISMLTSTLTTVFAFMPLLMIGSAVGEFIFGVPSVVILALLGSYICAVITTPTLAFIFFKKKDTSSNKKVKESKIKMFFDRLLKKSMHNKKTMIITAVIAFACTLGVAKTLEVSMFPKADKDLLYININSENANSLDITEELSDKASNILTKQEEVTDIVQGVGSGLPKFYMTVQTGAASNDFSQILVKFDLDKTNKFKNKDEFAAYLQIQMDKNIVGGKASVKLLDAGTGSSSPIDILVSSTSMQRLEETVEEISYIIDDIKGTTNVDDDFISKEYQFKVDVNTNKASSYGISKYDVQREVSMALKGANSSTFRKNNNEYDIIVKTDIKTKEDLENLKIKSSMSDNKVLLKQIANIEMESVYPVIKRYDRERTAHVTSDLELGYNASKMEKEIKKALDEKGLMDLEDVSISFDGEAGAVSDSFSDLGILAIFSLILIFGVLVYQFNSYIQPVLIVVTIPLALIGAIPALFITRQSMSFTALLGIVSLMGIVVNNAIVLIDYINLKRNEGMDIDEACESAVERRFSPIILSTTTTVIGLIPLVLAGGEMFRPMAIALIGGLCVGTILTLVVIPTLYDMVLNRNIKKLKK